MKTITKILTLFMALALLTNCSKKDDENIDPDPAVSCYEKVNDLGVIFAQANEAFINAPSLSTCNAFKAAYKKFIDAAIDCDNFLKENPDFEKAKQQWEQDLEGADCSGS